MSATYENFGVSFLYPENWQVTDESGEVDAGPKSVSIQSTTSGFWTLHVHDATADPQDLANQVLLTMETEYQEVESAAATEQIGEATLTGYDMDFYYLDFVISARVRSARIGKRTFVVFTQAETRDFDKLEPVFQAMLVSLLRGEAR